MLFGISKMEPLVEIDPTAKTLSILHPATRSEIYNDLKDQWINSDELAKYRFPVSGPTFVRCRVNDLLENWQLVGVENIYFKVY